MSLQTRLSGLITAVGSDIKALNTALAAKAPLVSPALSGAPTAPTPTATDNSIKIATTAFTKTTAKAVAFRAKLDANLGISGSGWSTVVCPHVLDETHAGWYNPANGRFTPQLPGWYSMFFLGYYIAPGAWAYATLFENGLTRERLVNQQGSGSLIAGGISLPRFLNGSTDYLSIGAQADSATSLYGDSGNEAYTTIGAMLVGL